ncbi:unnamed protein product [Tuber aestivum]|uniref:Peptidase S1 domain-containing protein n=1 Tax=Tuber aestivum TaxID=59557 RepID=A0A292Q1V8_9PEZI|nr:unnamed protein product [Tuber aestivum]
MSDSVPPPPFIVTTSVSKAYYKGLPSEPPLIATTKPNPIDAPTGPEAYTVLKELRYLGEHPLATLWDNGLAGELSSSLASMDVKWSSLDLLHIPNVGEPSGPAIVWIGVEPGGLSFEDGSKVAIDCHQLIGTHGVRDYCVEIRESRVSREARNRFLNPVLQSNATFSARDPYTATLGIPIAPKNRPFVQGTGGLFLSAGGDDKSIYLITARHVVLPIDDANQEYIRKNESRRREEVLVLGTSAFDNKFDAITHEISCQLSGMTGARERTLLFQGRDDPESVKECLEAEKQYKAAEEGIRELDALQKEVKIHWEGIENRVIGELTWAPPIILSTKPDEYTLDLAVIKLKPGTLDALNYRGNTINIGNKIPRIDFMNKMYLHYTSGSSFKYPPDGLVKLAGQVPESALFDLPMRDVNKEPCLIVFKNGAATGTTTGRANRVSSYTRRYFAGKYQESREWPVIATDKRSVAFSSRGDSGSCVADAYARVGGIITGGGGATDTSDVTYVTPISFIMKVLQKNKIFKYAHLNPQLT